MSESIEVTAGNLHRVVSRSVRQDAARDCILRILGSKPEAWPIRVDFSLREHILDLHRFRFSRPKFNPKSLKGGETLLNDLARSEDEVLASFAIDDGVELAYVWLSEDLTQLVGSLIGPLKV